MLLCLVLSTDMTFPGGEQTKGPLIANFFGEIMPSLNKLYNYLLKKVQSNGRNEIDDACEQLAVLDIEAEEEKERFMRMFKIGIPYSKIVY